MAEYNPLTIEKMLHDFNVAMDACVESGDLENSMVADMAQAAGRLAGYIVAMQNLPVSPRSTHFIVVERDDHKISIGANSTDALEYIKNEILGGDIDG